MPRIDNEKHSIGDGFLLLAQSYRTEVGFSEDAVLQGLWAAAVRAACEVHGTAALVDWLRNTADTIEARERKAAGMGDAKGRA